MGNKEKTQEFINYIDKESYLFPNPVKHNPYLKMSEDTVSKQFKQVLRKLKLNEDFKFHSLCHSAITELLKNNVP
jgi:site-specific recombinase XerD